MNNTKKSLFDSSVILIFSTVLVKIIGAIFKIPLAGDSFLGNEGFGYFSVAHDLFTPFYLLAISGLPVTVSHIIAKCIAEKRYSDVLQNFKLIKRLFLILGFTFSLIAALLSVPLVLFSTQSEKTLYCVLSVVPSVFLCFLISVYRGYFEGFNNMYPTAVSKIIEALIKLCLGLLVSYLIIQKTKQPAFAAAGAMLMVSLGTLLATLYLHIKKKYSDPLSKIEISNKKTTADFTYKTILIAAIPFALASLASSIVTLADLFTVKLQIDAQSKEYIDTLVKLNPGISGDVSTYLYGVRSKALTLHNLVPTFTVSIAVAAIPVLTGFSAKKDIDSFRQNSVYTLKLISLITFPASLGMIALSRPIMSLLYSTNTSLAKNMLILYGIGALFAGLCIPLMTLLQSFGNYKISLINLGIAFLIKIIIALTLVSKPQINIYAAPVSTIICYAYLMLSSLITLKINLHNIGFIDSFLKPFSAAVVCSGIAYILSQISNSKWMTMLSICVAIVVYFVIILITKTFAKEEIFSLKKFNSSKS